MTFKLIIEDIARVDRFFECEIRVNSGDDKKKEREQNTARKMQLRRKYSFWISCNAKRTSSHSNQPTRTHAICAEKTEHIDASISLSRFRFLWSFVHSILSARDVVTSSLALSAYALYQHRWLLLRWLLWLFSFSSSSASLSLFSDSMRPKNQQIMCVCPNLSPHSAFIRFFKNYDFTHILYVGSSVLSLSFSRIGLTGFSLFIVVIALTTHWWCSVLCTVDGLANKERPRASIYAHRLPYTHSIYAQTRKANGKNRGQREKHTIFCAALFFLFSFFFLSFFIYVWCRPTHVCQTGGGGSDIAIMCQCRWCACALRVSEWVWADAIVCCIII